MDGQLIQQWMKSCRLCLLDEGVKLPIFGEEGIIREVAHKIQTCFPMIVLYNADPLSKIICQRCMFMLDTVFNFRQKCIESNQTFISHVTEMKSNSSSVKQYLQALEKNSALEKIEKIPAKVPAVQLATQILIPESSKPSNPSIQRSTLASFRTRNAAANSKAQDKPVESDPISIGNLSSTTVRIKQEVIDSSDESSSGKSTPLIISVVGSYTDAQTVKRTETITKAAQELQEYRAPGAIKVKQEGQLLKPKFQSKLKSLKVITPWYCKFCNKYYKSKDTQYKHRRYFCPYKTLPCKFCNEVFKSENEVFEHAANHLRVYAFLKEEDLHPCQFCEKRFADSKMLAAHKQTHSGNLFVDSIQRPKSEEGATLRTRPALPSNSAKNFRKRVFKSRYNRRGAFSNIPRSNCPYCPSSYARPAKLTYHKKMNHLEEYIEEMEIKKELTQKVLSEEAKPVSEEVPAKEVNPETPAVPALPERSNVIRTAFHRPGPLSKQRAKRPVHQGLLRELLNKRILKCPICNKILGSPVGLQNHMRSHNDGTPIGPKMNRCTYCSRLFGSKGGLQYHLATQHPNDDPCKDAYRCQPCNITFSSRPEWFTHKLSHNKGLKMKRRESSATTPNRPKLLLCCYCNQVFSEAAELKAHQLTHKVVTASLHVVPKTPAAPTPSARPNTPAAQGLGQGVQQENGGEVWPCSMCNKVCSTKRNLGRHTKTHELRAHCSHHCNLCSKKFISKAALLRHDAFIHSTAKSFRCQKCSKIFFRKGSYLNHLNTACVRPARLTESMVPILPVPGNPANVFEAPAESFPETNQMKICDKCGFTRTVGHKCDLWMVNLQTNPVKRHISRRSYRCRICGATFASSYSHNSHMKAHVNHRNNKLHILKVPGTPQASLNFADVPLLEESVVHILPPPPPPPCPEFNMTAPLDLSYNEPTASAGCDSGILHPPPSGADQPLAGDTASLPAAEVSYTNGSLPPSVDHLFFQCVHCTKTFHSEQGLAAHAVSHEGTKTTTSPFDCPACSRSCGDSQALNLHVLLSHPENDVIRDNGSVSQNVDA